MGWEQIAPDHARFRLEQRDAVRGYTPGRALLDESGRFVSFTVDAPWRRYQRRAAHFARQAGLTVRRPYSAGSFS